VDDPQPSRAVAARDHEGAGTGSHLCVAPISACGTGRPQGVSTPRLSSHIRRCLRCDIGSGAASGASEVLTRPRTPVLCRIGATHRRAYRTEADRKVPCVPCAHSPPANMLAACQPASFSRVTRRCTSSVFCLAIARHSAVALDCAAQWLRRIIGAGPTGNRRHWNRGVSDPRTGPGPQSGRQRGSLTPRFRTDSDRNRVWGGKERRPR
jgi:hypothetical protein